MEKPPVSGSEQKIKEYVARIEGGESKESILQGLPPSFVSGIEAALAAKEARPSENGISQGLHLIPTQYQGLGSDVLDFIWTIPEYVNPEKTKSEKERKQRALDSLRQKETEAARIDKEKTDTELKAELIKNQLGVGSEENLASKQQELEVLKNKAEGAPNPLSGIVKYVTEGRKQVVVDLYENLLNDSSQPESRTKLASALFQDIYNKYRIAEYPTDMEERETWEGAFKDTSVEINNKKPEWMYRGIFPKNGEETVTRGSFNVDVTPALIKALDNLIISGKIKANYKFGAPGTQAAPTERHDSITIYFLEEPTEEALEELGNLVKPYVRGDNLLGKKIADGFYMSEIGSIESSQIESLIQELQAKDPSFTEAIKGWTAPSTSSKSRSHQMSEAQYYAIKDVARAFGYNLSYEKDLGFKIN